MVKLAWQVEERGKGEKIASRKHAQNRGRERGRKRRKEEKVDGEVIIFVIINISGRVLPVA